MPDSCLRDFAPVAFDNSAGHGGKLVADAFGAALQQVVPVRVARRQQVFRTMQQDVVDQGFGLAQLRQFEFRIFRPHRRGEAVEHGVDDFLAEVMRKPIADRGRIGAVVPVLCVNFFM